MEKITLKKLVNHHNKRIYIPLLTGAFMACYMGSGAISNQNPGMLPMSQLEQDIPFWTWTIWIYIIFYPCYLTWALFSYKEEGQMNKTLYGFVVLTIISCLIFIIYPVGYPRSLFPLPLDNEVTTLIFRAMRKVDNPSNCLPSLHVGLCFLFAWGFYQENRKKFWISIACSVLISISTLTTKQHYIYDIVLGFGLSTAIYFVFAKKTQIKA